MSTNTAQTERKKRLTPKLRFKEFTEKWDANSLIDLSVNGFSNGAFNDPKKVGSGYRIINVKDMYINGTINIDTLTRVAIAEQEFLKNRVEYGDIFFTRSSLVKEGIAYSNVNLNSVDDLTYDGHLIRMRPNKVKHSPLFLYYNFSTTTARKQFIKRGKTATMTTIGQEDIAKVEITFPTLPEQQKIASFLSAVDVKIQQLTRKKELLEQHKKGVMQQLFSGKLRFKDENGKPYPKWEKKLFEEIYSFYSTNSLSRDKLNYESGTVKNIHYGDIHTKFSSQFIVNEEYVPYINSDVDLSKVKEENYCREGDLVIADASEDYNDIGKSIELVKLNNEKVVAGLHTFLARPDLSRIKIGFSGYLVQASYVRMQVKKIAQGTKVLSLAPSRLGKVKLSIPSKGEQQKIASFLTALDAKIESVAAQIAHTQTFKKGLLQQMFV